MKDELQNKLVEILTSIQTAAGKAGDFAMIQLPDIAQSYILYGRALSLLQLTGGVLLLAASGWLLLQVKAHIRAQSCFEDSNPAFIIPGLGIALFFALLGGRTVSVATPDAVLVWLAPKVWLLKEIGTLLK